MFGKVKAKFTSPVLADRPLPEVTMFVDKKDFYVNKDIFNMYMLALGSDKKTNKDFVKMTFDKALASSMGVDANYYNNIMEKNVSKATTRKVLDFFGKIDIGMDTGLTKDGDTYKLSWNADKMVDVTNAYVKYVFKNPESIVNMYKEIYGIDIIAEMKKSDSTMTEAKFKKSMNEASVQWTKEIEPMLPKFKKKIAPTIPATNKEIQGVAAPSCSANSRLKTTPEKAPITIIPSRPTLTTPPRSEKTPPILVKISGAE